MPPNILSLFNKSVNIIFFISCGRLFFLSDRPCSLIMSMMMVIGAVFCTSAIAGNVIIIWVFCKAGRLLLSWRMETHKSSNFQMFFSFFKWGISAVSGRVTFLLPSVCCSFFNETEAEEQMFFNQMFSAIDSRHHIHLLQMMGKCVCPPDMGNPPPPPVVMFLCPLFDGANFFVHCPLGGGWEVSVGGCCWAWEAGQWRPPCLSVCGLLCKHLPACPPPLPPPCTPTPSKAGWQCFAFSLMWACLPDPNSVMGRRKKCFGDGGWATWCP